VDAPHAADPLLVRAVDRFLAASPGVYGLLVASPERILFERYGVGGAPDRVTPSWSLNKSMTGTLIGRLIRLGWLENVYAAAPAPAWRDPRGIHALITLDDLLRMRSGLAMPCVGPEGSMIGFEGSAVYFDAVDAFAAAQANIVAVRPGAVFRYINAGINVLAAIIRDRIERCGLPYHETVYGLLPDLLGMASYRMSADIAGNLIGSGSAFATLRDWAKLAVLYLQDGMWDGERLLPEGWAQYALAAQHGGTSYAATFWTNADRRFPALPPDAAWLSGASHQRVFILRGTGRIVAVSNETDAAMDLAALNEVLAAI
jgi:CubicO group peptidase (beta-lactamase class C family)